LAMLVGSRPGFFRTGVTAAVFNSRGTEPVLSSWEMRSEIGREITDAHFFF